MPYPEKGESKEEYISRCIPYMISKEGKEKDQAVAMCYSFWKEYQPESIDVVNKLDLFLNESSEKLIMEVTSVDVENFIEVYMKNTKKPIDKDTMADIVSKKLRCDDEDFEDAWEGMVDDGVLVKASGQKYKWRG